MTNKQIALLAAAIRRVNSTTVGNMLADDVMADADKYFAWLTNLKKDER